MTVAGGAAGAPIRTAKCVTIDLDVPADSEIVIEGLIDPELLEPEGPFGESNGYVALEDYNMIMQVTAITHRRTPVFASILSQITPSESSVIKKVAYEPAFLAHLRDQLSIKGIRRVVMHGAAEQRPPHHFPGIRQRHSAHRSLARTARRGHQASRLRQDRHRRQRRHRPHKHGRRVVVARLPRESRRGRAHRAVPFARPRAEIRLAIPGFDHVDRRDLESILPPLALPTREYMERAQAIWKELGLPPVSIRPPWHGYSLGDWNDAWDIFAKNAVAEEWEKNGANTATRRRGGLIPETPVRSVEGREKT